MNESPEPIEYQSPRPRTFSNIGGGVALLFAGLGLIVIGGCFLIGILMLYSSPSLGGNSFMSWPLPLMALPWVLYTLSFGCVGGAIWMIAAGIRWLFNAGR
jgi:hypothetical protein